MQKMKQVIDGKSYDTSNADEICDVPSSGAPGDLGWHDTTLYRTAKGQFFIAGKGGPRSMWAEAAGQTTSRSGSGLRAVADEQARHFMEAAGCSAEKFNEVDLSVEEA
jgi:hypothetical protein